MFPLYLQKTFDRNFNCHQTDISINTKSGKTAQRRQGTKAADNNYHCLKSKFGEKNSPEINQPTEKDCGSIIKYLKDRFAKQAMH